jgi:DNA-3-methyladenine glycosylase II
MYTVKGNIIPVAPFDYAKSLDFLGFFAPMQGEQVVTEQQLTKTLFVEGQLIAFQLISTGTVDSPHLEYTLFSEQPIADGMFEATIDRISFFLSLNDDLRPFYTIAEQDANFAPVLRELYGYHQVKFLTPFECACWAVLTQRNPMNVAQHMKQSIIERYGGSISVDGTTYWAFPEAQRMAHLSENELLSVVRNARKAEYLVAVIKAFITVDEQFLRDGDYAEVALWLHNIRGFGEWSTSFVMLRSLGRMEYAPFSEKKFLSAASRLYGHGTDLSRTEIAELAERYGDTQGYWAHYVRVGV